MKTRKQQLFPLWKQFKSIQNGSKLVVFTDGKNVLLKPLRDFSMEEFRSLIQASRAFAKKRKLKKGDANAVILRVRHANRG